jgi:hypothetical protein
MHIHPPTEWTVRSLASWAASAIFLSFGGLLMEENAKDYIKAHHWETLWVKAVDVLPDLSSLVANQWFWATLWASGGMAVGLSLDTSLKRIPKWRTEEHPTPPSQNNLTDISARFPTTNWNEPLKSVFKEHYKDRTMKIDGKEFIECTFENVTLIYDGTRPARITNCKRTPNVTIETGNPIINNTVEILAAFGLTNKPDRALGKVTDRGIE